MTTRTLSPGVANSPSPDKEITSKASDLGFSACHFTDAHLPAAKENRLREAIAQGHHGSMAWMETRIAERSHPQTLWPQAKTVIMLGLNYGPDHNPLDALNQKSHGLLSVYAQNEDYHDVVKKRLKQLGRWMCERYGCDIKVFVDTAPVMEKPLAQQAGLGWQGKHTNLVSREYGSWLFLGSIFTTLELPAHPAEIDHCGSCQSCLDICPTDAFPAPYKLDARRCISYLTIEHKGHIAEEFRSHMGNRIYGCDDCLAICPWNKFASQTEEMKFTPREELKSPLLSDLAQLDDQAFRTLFRKSPVKRIGRDRFIRNVMIAIGNSGDSALLPIVRKNMKDPSPLVRAMAIWAWGQLKGDKQEIHHLSHHETDPHVRREYERLKKPSPRN
ncbi:MAG: tRNA epoxyqueuosine(34) reductase QueG [Pseudomonadota bacterium]